MLNTNGKPIMINREVNMYESINVGRIYVMTLKELQFLVDRMGTWRFHEGYAYV